LSALEPLLECLGIDRLDSPERLPWLLAIAAASVWLAARRTPPALHWPGAAQVEARQRGSRGLADGFALLARGLALACLALALCAPVALRALPPEPGAGLDLVLVLDASGSMGALDTLVAAEALVGAEPVIQSKPFSAAGASFSAEPPLPTDPAVAAERRTRRIDLALRVVGRFAAQRIREGDRIGLVVFGEHAFTQCPLTHDGRLLEAALARIDVGTAGDATALGDALALAVRRVERAEGEAGRAVVLLTDGRSNAGRIPVSVALELARAADVRVHSVAIGSDAVEVPLEPGFEAHTGRHRPERGALARIARETGGSFFIATAERDLARVYAAIDALERPPRPRPARRLERPRSRGLLAAAGALLAVEVGFVRVLRRRTPA